MNWQPGCCDQDRYPVRSRCIPHVAIVHPSPDSLTGALAAYNYATEQDPLDENAWHARGEHYESWLELGRAIAGYTRALAINPDRLDARLDRAFCFARTAQHELAIADYDKAIRLDPGRAHSWFLRGSAHEAAGEIGSDR